MKSIGLGIVGCAHACRDLHRPWLLAKPEHWDVRGLFDLKRELAETEANEFGGNAKAEESLNSLLSRGDIDVVLVLTKPPTTHFEVAKQVIEAGKDCWIEKPFAQTTAQCDELLDLAEKKGVKLFVYQNRRWDSNFQKARSIVESGRLGRISLVQIGFDVTGMDWGVHVMDQALRFGNGELRQVYAWSSNPDKEENVPCSIEFIFERPPAVRLQFMPSTPETADAQTFARFYIVGEGRTTDGRNFEVVPRGEEWPDQASVYKSLYAWMREDGPCPVNPVGARNAIYAFELIKESARQKCSITPNNWKREL